MRAAHGCIVPSRFENQCRVPVEAMSVGIPVLVSDIAAFREACGQAAFYFSLDNPKELAHHIAALLADPSLRQTAGEAGLERVGAMQPSEAAEHILSAFEAGA
jgi:glycosyltransferase involved in cell wall biosynthesis